MNIVKYYFDNNRNIINVKYSNTDNSIPQSSNDNYIYLYSDEKYINVDLKLRQPDGSVLPVIHMSYGVDEDGNKCWIRRLPFSYTDFKMSNITARVELSFSLYYYNKDYQIAYPTTVASQIIVKRTVSGNTETDGSYNGTDVQELWKQVGIITKYVNKLDTEIGELHPAQYKTINGESILGSGNIKILDMKNLKVVSDIGSSEVDYNTTDGITITSTDLYEFEGGDSVEVQSIHELPIFPGKNINIDANEAGTGIIISSEALHHVNINVPASAVNGNLTNEQLNILKGDYDSYIIFSSVDNHYEIFRLNTDAQENGSLAYSHLEYENNKWWIKVITVTTTTGSWVLNKKELQ